MVPVVQHSVILPGLPGKLYSMYLDPAEHAAMTGGGEVQIAAKVGAEFWGFGGRITGCILALTPGRQIVQSWRSFEWQKGDLDSVLILTFTASGAGSQVDLVQASVPEHLYQTLQNNWPMRYFDPWRAYLEQGK
jgi:activator of HSP90 ATPase